MSIAFVVPSLGPLAAQDEDVVQLLLGLGRFGEFVAAVGGAGAPV